MLLVRGEDVDTLWPPAIDKLWLCPALRRQRMKARL